MFMIRMKTGQAYQETPSESELLTREEMIALRLYTGPAYQPLNDFSRDLWKVSTRTFSVELVHGIRRLTVLNSPLLHSSA